MGRSLLAVLLLAAVSYALASCEAMCDDDERFRGGLCRSAPPACGDPPPGTCWEQCSYIVPDVCWTVCASGDEGCPCWDDSHCQGACFGDDLNACQDEKIDGQCGGTTASLRLGCHCYVNDGLGEVTCAD